MERTVKLDYGPGDPVTLRTDPEGLKRLVVRVSVHEGGAEYGLRRGDGDITYHGSLEIMDYKDDNNKIAGFRK